MKKILFSIIAAALTLPAFAQWTTGTGTIYPTTLTNKVGIGTSSPSTWLHLLGTTEQFRLGYDASNYTSLSTSSSGGLTITRNGTGASTESVAFSASAGELAVTSNNNSNPAFYVRGNGTGDIVNVLDGATNVFAIKDGGNVGVGTNNPSDKLHVVGSGGVMISNNGFYGLRFYNLADNSQKMHLYWRPSDDVIEMNTGGGSGRQISFVTNGVEQLRINASGGIGIGTSNIPSQYKLAVNGAAVATSMTVKLQANWPDFVFLKDHKLPTLTEVKTYIEKNQHLPDMPSANEVYKNGLDLGEMNRLLLKKVEELTLYLIEKDQQLDKQQQANQSQQEQIEAIKRQLNMITKTLAVTLKAME